jgi:hypothetical protein
VRRLKETTITPTISCVFKKLGFFSPLPSPGKKIKIIITSEKSEIEMKELE